MKQFEFFLFIFFTISMLNQSGAQFCGCDDYLHDRISQSKLAAILFILFFFLLCKCCWLDKEGGRLFTAFIYLSVPKKNNSQNALMQFRENYNNKKNNNNNLKRSRKNLL